MAGTPTPETQSPQFAGRTKRRVLGVICGILTVLTFAFVLLAQEAAGDFATIANWLPALTFLALVIVFPMYLNATSMSGEEALANDSRPPIIYLRSFTDDDSGEVAEQALQSVVSDSGPFVAIGRPGDPVPRVFAASRFYLDHDNWQQSVTDLLNRASLVFLRIGATEGLHWELGQCIQLLHPYRLVLLVPNDRPAYEHFAATAASSGLNIRMPDLPRGFESKNKAGDLAGLVHFDENWTGALQQFDRHWLKGTVNATLSNRYRERLQAALQTTAQRLGLAIEPPRTNFGLLAIPLLIVVSVIALTVALILQQQDF